MEKITTVGLDLAKQVMAVHGVGVAGRMILRKVLRRDQLLIWSASVSLCVIAMEACGGAHYWARELTRQGHTARIIAAEYVQPFRLGGKNDANDAEAICTAARQPHMRFVAIKSVEQQAALCVHRLRQGLVEERTALLKWSAHVNQRLMPDPSLYADVPYAGHRPHCGPPASFFRQAA